MVGAVGGQTSDFFIHRDFWSSSSHDRGFSERIEVATLGFTDLLKRHNPTFLVIDIEGGEIQLVDTDLPPNVRSVLIELHKHIVGVDGVNQVVEWLHRQGLTRADDWSTRAVAYFYRSENR